jgi:hypothetical protein
MLVSAGFERTCRVLFGLLVLLFADTGRAQTIIGPGNLPTQTWTATGSPYLLSGDVTVPAGATLTIDAGTVVRCASTDASGSGLDTARIELTVAGVLDVNGTPGSPVIFEASASPAPSRWYGIVVQAGSSSVQIDHASLSSTVHAIRTSVGGSVLSVSDTAISGSGNSGVFVLAGTPALTRLSISTPGFYGVLVSSTGRPTLSQSLVRNATAAGVSISTSAGPPTTLVTQSTLDQNAEGVVVANATSAALISNSIFTSHTSSAVRNSGGTAQVTHSDFFNNASNFIGVSPGTGVIFGNPLYVGGASYALTSNSPARFAGSSSQDLGAFPFAGAPTVGLLGTLWSSITLGSAGSPHQVIGDLTVPAGQTLNLTPGATLSFAAGDQMAGGVSTTRTELIVNGILQAGGTAVQPVLLTTPGGIPGQWEGVRIGAGAIGANLSHTVIEYAREGIVTSAPANQLVISPGVVIRNSSVAGLSVLAGTPVLQQLTVSATTGPGVRFTGTGSGTLSSCLLTANTDAGVRLSSSTGPPVQISQCTFDGNGTGVVVSGSTSTQALVANSIVTNGNTGVSATSPASLTVSHTDLFANATNLTGSGLIQGAGLMFANPLYVGGGSYALTSNSPARFAGNAGQDLGAFPFAGAPTTGLLGTLWSSTTLDAASGPHAVTGDLTVAPDVTLTLEPGATLEFANGDAMAGGSDVSRSELSVLGQLVAQGSKNAPVVLRSVTPPASWMGLRFLAGSTGSSLAWASIEDAQVGISLDANETISVSYTRIVDPIAQGALATSGHLMLQGVRIDEASTAVALNGTSRASITSSILDNNGIGVTVSTSGVLPTQIDGCTFDSNGEGIVTSSPSANAQVRNSIFSFHATGLRRSFGTLTVQTSNFWGNSTDLNGVSGNPGLLFVDPLYAAPGSDYHLAPTSPCIDAGGPSTATHDFDGFPRPSNGVHDIGAYELQAVPSLPWIAWLALLLLLVTAGMRELTRTLR